ncbi:helix-turn-helix transcriptional regulator [Arthrobacter psychrolactophilus]
MKQDVPPAASSPRSTLDDEQRLSAVACLNDPVRQQLFELLRSSEAGQGLSRDDCVDSLGLPRSTVRAQLDRLVEERLVHVEFHELGERNGPGSGRPSKLYFIAQEEVTASFPPRHYDLAARLLAAAVQRSIDGSEDIESALSQVAHAEGRRMGEQAGGIHAVLAGAGYDPQDDGRGGTIMANCPFHRLSAEHAGVVCSLNGALLGGALEGCGDSEHELAPDHEISHCCARLVPRN